MIITDYEMPYMDGVEFRTEQMKQPRLAEIHTIMWTGRHPDDVPHLPGLEVLAKPVDMFELRQRMTG
jgi:CheY-like chemotaxis protein